MKVIDFKRLVNDLGVLQKDLALLLNVEPPNITKVKRGDMRLPKKCITIIKDNYPNITIEDYMIDMPDNQDNTNTISEPNPSYQTEVTQLPFDDFEEVPYISINAQAGYLDSFNDNRANDYLNELDTMLIPKQFEKGKYVVVEVKGDSMDDGTKRSISEGEKLLCKDLQKHHWRNKLYYRQYLFVIVNYRGVVIKEITNHDVEKGIITCHSWNPLYQDFDVNLNEVHQLYYVKKKVESKIIF